MHFSKTTAAAALAGVAAAAPTYDSEAPPAYGSSSYGGGYGSSSSYGGAASYSSSSVYYSKSYPAPYGSSSSYAYGVSGSSSSAYYPSATYPASSSSYFSSYPSAASSYSSSASAYPTPDCWSACFAEAEISGPSDLCGNEDVSACIAETCDDEDDKKYWEWYTDYCAAPSSSSYSYGPVSSSASYSYSYYPSASSSYSYGPISSSASYSYSYYPSASSSYSSSSAYPTPSCWSECFAEAEISGPSELCGNEEVSACIAETCDDEDDKKYWEWYTDYCAAPSSSAGPISSSYYPSSSGSYSYGPISSSASYPDGYPKPSSSIYVHPVSSSAVPYGPEHPGNDGGFGGKGECYGHSNSGVGGGSGSGVGGGDETSPVGGGSGSGSGVGGGSGSGAGYCPAGCFPEAPSCPSEGDGGFCISDADAQTVADIFQELIQSYSDELALAALTEDFTDWTSAVGIIIEQIGAGDVNLIEPLFVGRDAFMAAQGSQPEIPFTQTHVFHGCNSVSMRWYTTRSAAGQETESARIPVVGLTILEVVPAAPEDEYNFRIKQIFSEFNTAAWLINLGVFQDHSGGASLQKRGLSGINALGATL